jgi:hypothetical protein
MQGIDGTSVVVVRTQRRRAHAMLLRFVVPLHFQCFPVAKLSLFRVGI